MRFVACGIRSAGWLASMHAGSALRVCRFELLHTPLLRNALGLNVYLWLAAFLFFALAMAPIALAQKSAEAASGPPYTIGLITETPTSQPCYSDGRQEAMAFMVERATAQINARGGLYGRLIQVKSVTIGTDAAEAIKDLRALIATPNLLGLVGFSRDAMAREVLGALGEELDKTGIPFLTSLTDRRTFADLKSVYSTEPPRLRQTLPVVADFIKTSNFSHVGFVGRADNFDSVGVGAEVLERIGFETLSWYEELTVRAGRFDEEEVKNLITQIGTPASGKDETEKPVQLVILDFGARNAAAIIKRLKEAKQTPAIFITRPVEELTSANLSGYPNAIFQIDWDAVPEVYNNNIIELVTNDQPERGIFAGDIALDRIPEVIRNHLTQGVNDDIGTWVFSGRKAVGSPGWGNGFCDQVKVPSTDSAVTPDNLSAVRYGARYSDILNLMVDAARASDRDKAIEAVRGNIRARLRERYVTGRGAYQGQLRNWSFDQEWRTGSRRPFVVIWPNGLGRKQLAQLQFARAKARDKERQTLRRITTLYADIDLIRIYSVDDNLKSFHADFYLSMREADRTNIETLDFTNAYIDPRTGGRQLIIEPLHEGGESDIYPEAMRVYRISGKFRFKPKLANYPFDSQLFTIDIQPKSGNNPFIVQPPPLELRNKELASDGWTQSEQYVGFTSEFIPIVDAFTHTPSVVPFYTASFTWKLKRETTDYFLRVVVPLAFILIVAYFSIFIPQTHLEAIVTIQITALLSAVALYLSLPQLDADTATVSDRIFVFDYMMVSFMIMISIMRINTRLAKMQWLDRTLSFTHIVLVPVVVLVMVYSVYQVSQVSA